VLRDEIGGQMARNEIRIAADGGRNRAPQSARVEPLGRRVFGRHAAHFANGCAFARRVGEYRDFGMCELFVEAVALHVSGDQQQCVLPHLFRDRISTAKPLQRDGSGVVTDERLEDAPAKAPTPRSERATKHARHEGRAGPHLETPNRL